MARHAICTKTDWDNNLPLTVGIPLFYKHNILNIKFVVHNKCYDIIRDSF